MTPKVRQRIEALQEVTECETQAAVIRKALAVYEFLWQEIEKGGRVVVRTEKGDREVVIL
jgi:hypothetical protein